MAAFTDYDNLVEGVGDWLARPALGDIVSTSPAKIRSKIGWKVEEGLSACFWDLYLRLGGARSTFL